MTMILAPLGKKPLRMAALIFITMIAVRVAGEFGAGFFEGLMAEFANGV